MVIFGGLFLEGWSWTRNWEDIFWDLTRILSFWILTETWKSGGVWRTRIWPLRRMRFREYFWIEETKTEELGKIWKEAL